MEELKVFVSVGATATAEQEAFVRAVEDRLRSEGLIPYTVGRNKFAADAPLKTVTELLDECVGTVVIALERYYYPNGTEKRGGPKEAPIRETKLATPWNQIEAAMAYIKGLPLLVIVENGVKSEGLLERGYDWYVQSVDPIPSALASNEFNGVFASWKQKLTSSKKPVSAPGSLIDLTIGDLIRRLTPAQLWSILGAIVVLVGGAFSLGAKLIGA